MYTFVKERESEARTKLVHVDTRVVPCRYTRCLKFKATRYTVSNIYICIFVRPKNPGGACGELHHNAKEEEEEEEVRSMTTTIPRRDEPWLLEGTGTCLEFQNARRERDAHGIPAR